MTGSERRPEPRYDCPQNGSPPQCDNHRSSRYRGVLYNASSDGVITHGTKKKIRYFYSQHKLLHTDPSSISRQRHNMLHPASTTPGNRPHRSLHIPSYHPAAVTLGSSWLAAGVSVRTASRPLLTPTLATALLLLLRHEIFIARCSKYSWQRANYHFS